jgi:hypothetical protein
MEGDRMLEQALAALATMGGNAIVTAMVCDGWESLRLRFARLLGRGEAGAAEEIAAKLAQSQAELTAAAGADAARVRTEQEIAWRTRLADWLEQDPGGAGELRALVAEAQAQTIGSAGRVEQHVTGSGNAQQAVQGHGVQTNVFGGQDEPGARH